MKNRKICPKCNSTDLIRVPGKAGAYGVGNNIMVGATIFSAINVNRYVCCTCGFSEEWIDKSDLEKLQCLKDTTPDKSFGSKQVYKYYGDINEDDLKFIESLNINLETMNLQDMFVHLTKRGNTNE